MANICDIFPSSRNARDMTQHDRALAQISHRPNIDTSRENQKANPDFIKVKPPYFHDVSSTLLLPISEVLNILPSLTN